MSKEIHDNSYVYYDKYHYIPAPNLAFVLSQQIYSSLYISTYTVSSDELFS